MPREDSANSTTRLATKADLRRFERSLLIAVGLMHFAAVIVVIFFMVTFR